MLSPITVTVKRRLPSQNTFNNTRGYTGSIAYKTERNKWYALLRAALIPKQPPTHKVTAKIISFRCALLDYGNLVGGAKAIPDALKNLGYIKDDNPTFFECIYEQRKCPRNAECTVIHLNNP